MAQPWQPWTMRVQKTFLLSVLVAGLGLMPGMLAAQNYTLWPVTRIAAGGFHSLFTKPDGTVYVMGSNLHGQLGLGSTVLKTNVPTALTNGVGLIAAGENYSLIARGHALLATGDNTHGQLGDGTVKTQYFPEQVFTIGSTLQFGALAAGEYHSLFIAGNRLNGSGGLWAMGDNGAGELGDGSYTDKHSPEVILSWTILQPGVAAISAGDTHSIFLKSDGSVWGMGNYDQGQLGIPPPTDGSEGLTNNPIMVYSGTGVNYPATSIAAGGFCSLWVSSDNFLWGTGDNLDNELAEPTAAEGGYDNLETPLQIAGGGFGPGTNSAPITVAAGSSQTFFISSDSTLWAVGYDSNGQLGSGGRNYSTWVFQLIASNVVAVAGGEFHTLFLKSDGSLWGMGDNENGQLGTGDYTERDTPVEIVAPPPQLNITPYGASVILAWPTNAAGFVLQSSTNLASSNWTTYSPGPVVLGGQFAVFTSASDQTRYFRLALSQ